MVVCENPQEMWAGVGNMATGVLLQRWGQNEGIWSLETKRGKFCGQLTKREDFK